MPTNHRNANTAWQRISVLTMNQICHFRIAVGADERTA